MMEEMFLFESRASHGKFQKLLKDLKSQDDMELITASRNLSLELSMVQSVESISFNVEQFIPVLLDLLKMDSLPEIPENAVISMNHIIDLYPQVARRFSDQRTINTIFSVFQSDRLFESIDPSVSLLKKISENYGNAVMNSPSFKMMFNFQDFCTVATHSHLLSYFWRKQKNMIDILINVVKSIKRKEDFESKFQEIIGGFIDYHVGNPDKQQLIFELAAKLVNKMAKIYEKDNEKKRELVELVLWSPSGTESLLMTEAFHRLSVFKGQANAAEWQCVQNVLQILAKCCLFSIKIYAKVLDKNLLGIANELLNIVIYKEGGEKQMESFALELVALLNAVLTVNPKPEGIILAVASRIGIKIEASEKANHKEKLDLMLNKYEEQSKQIFQSILGSIRAISEKNKDSIYKYICVYTFQKVISIIAVGKKRLSDYVNYQTLSGIFFVYLQSHDSMTTTLALVALQYYASHLASPEAVHALFREGVFDALGKIGTNEWKELMEASLPVECSFLSSSAMIRENFERKLKSYPFSDANSSINSQPNHQRSRHWLKEESFLSLNDSHQKMSDLIEEMQLKNMENEEDSESESSHEALSKQTVQPENPESMKIEMEPPLSIVAQIQKLAEEIKSTLSNLSTEMKLHEMMRKEEELLQTISSLLKKGSMDSLDALARYVQDNKGLSINQIKSSKIVESLFELISTPNSQQNMANCRDIIGMMSSKTIFAQSGGQVQTLWDFLLEKLLDHINEEPAINFSLQKEQSKSGRESITKEICIVSSPALCQFVFKKKEDFKKTENNFLRDLESNNTPFSAQRLECYSQVAEELIQNKRKLFQKVKSFPLQIEKYATFKAIEKFLLKEIQVPEDLLGLGPQNRKRAISDVKLPDGLVSNREDDSTDFFIEKYEREESSPPNAGFSNLGKEIGLEEVEDSDEDSENMMLALKEELELEEELLGRNTGSSKSQKSSVSKSRGSVSNSRGKGSIKKKEEKGEKHMFEMNEGSGSRLRNRSKKESKKEIKPVKTKRQSANKSLKSTLAASLFEKDKNESKYRFPGPPIGGRGGLLGPGTKRVNSVCSLEPSTRDIKANHYITVNFYFEGKLIDPEMTLIEVVPYFRNEPRSFMERNQIFEFDFTVRTNQKTASLVKEEPFGRIKENFLENERKNNLILSNEQSFPAFFDRINKESFDFFSTIKKIEPFTKAAMGFLAAVNNYDITLKQPLRRGDQGCLIPTPLKMANNIRAVLNRPINIASRRRPEHLKEIVKHFRTSLPFEIRLLVFRLTSFRPSKELYYYTHINKNELKDLGSLPIGRLTRKKYMVSRQHILESFLCIFLNSSNKNTVNEFSFSGEEGSGLGPTLEFYTLVSHRVQKRDLRIFQTLENLTLWPDVLTTHPPEKLDSLFRALGMMFGRVISDLRIIDLPLNQVFWDLVLDRHVTIYDLANIDFSLYSFMLEIYNIADQSQRILADSRLSTMEKNLAIQNLGYRGVPLTQLCIYFVHPYNPNIELIEGGKNLLLSSENAQLYIDSFLRSFFFDSIRIQINSFKTGLFKFIEKCSFDIFHSFEMEMLLCGEKFERWTMDLLKEVVVPEHGYTHHSLPYIYLLETMCEMNADEQKMFVKFLTGTPRLPCGGIGALNPHLKVVRKEDSFSGEKSSALPSVMTYLLLLYLNLICGSSCQNYMKLPNYSTKEYLRQKLFLAMKEGGEKFLQT